jgi:radical SAM superfamily enzyme YgiQ (UPF0313 family)
MSSCLEQSGNKVNFIDADVHRLNPIRVVELLKDDPPQLIGISLNVSQVSHSVEYIEEIEKHFPHVPIILGGPYVTGVQEEIFKDFPSVRYAIVHEGEYAMMDFVDFLKGQKNIEEVRNLIYKINGKVNKNRVERILDLDFLPLPNYSHIFEYVDKYKAPYPSMASPSVAIMCTRGCPYHCTFCSSPVTWGRKVTFRKTDDIINEIFYLKEAIKVKEIFFQDDTLNARPKWFFELCEKIIENGLHKEIFFKCPFRVNKEILSEELLKKAKAANFWMIFYGVESGNQEMLNHMKKNITVEEIKRAFRLTRKAGLATFASFMIGNYGETKRTVRDSMKLLKNIMPDYGGFAIAAPFPGSELYRIAVEKKLITVTDFKKYQYGNCILKTETLDIKDIVSLANEANHLFDRIHRSFRYRIINKKSLFTKMVGEGFYPKELWHTWVNRTMRRVSYLLPAKEDAQNVCMKILADYPDISKRPVKLRLWINGTKYLTLLDQNEWVEFRFPIVRHIDSRFIYIQWKVSRTWTPQKFNVNEDERELGITVEKIWLA